MLEPPARSPAPFLCRLPSEQSVATISTYQTALSTLQNIGAESLKDVPIVAVMGPTGAGKSTFVKIATGADHVQIGAALTSCTQKIQVAQCHNSTHKSGVILIDTPGFDDTLRSDAEILEEIANWLQETYEVGIKLSGILYFHRITDNRVSNTLLRNLVLFQNLCGSAALSNVTFVTTHWDHLQDAEEGVRNEEQLRNEYWKPFLESGSQMLRFEHTPASAWNIVNSLPMIQMPLEIQREMVDQRKPLADTAAAQSLVGWLVSTTMALRKIIRRLERLVKKAKSSTKGDNPEDASLQKALNEAKTNLEEVVGQRSLVSDPHHSPTQEMPSRPHKSLRRRLKNRFSSHRINLTFESTDSLISNWSEVAPISTHPRDLPIQSTPVLMHPQNSPTQVTPSSPRSQTLSTQVIAPPAHHPNPPPALTNESHLVQDCATSEDLQLRLYGIVSEIVQNKGTRKAFCKTLTNGEGAQGRAQAVADYLNAVLRNTKMLKENDRPYILRLFCRLIKATEVYPSCYVLEEINTDSLPIHGGGFADVYKGSYKDQVVCCKALRLIGKSSDRVSILRTYAKEIALWSHLSHKNILPFYGVHPLGNRISLISPWMENGDLRQYLEKFPSTLRVPFVQQIIDGLMYLHELEIVHGDLKAENVLVSGDGRVLVADFGLSVIATSILASSGQSPMGGTTGWMAPELFSLTVPVKPTKESDIWAYGCVCYEIFLGRRPFYQYGSRSGVMLALLQGEVPSRPKAVDDGVCAEFEEWMWEMMSGCWKKEPQDRYTGETIRHLLELKGAPGEPAKTSNSQIEETPALWEAAKTQSEAIVDWKLVESVLVEFKSTWSEECSGTFLPPQPVN